MITFDNASEYQSKIEKLNEEIDDIVSGRYKELGAELRLHVVKPFCQKFNLTFYTCGGDLWRFKFNTPGRDHGRLWEVGEEPRPNHARPEGYEGEEDQWWFEIAEEERAIKGLLDKGDYRGGSNLGSWVADYPDKHGR